MEDYDLLENAVSHHGLELLEVIHREQKSQSLPSRIGTQGSLTGNKEEDNRKKLHQFIGRNADLLFKLGDEEARIKAEKCDREDGELYAVMPPIEAFMDPPVSGRRRQFFKSVNKGDIIVATVASVQESGVVLMLMCLDYGNARHLVNLRLTAFCPLRELPRQRTHEDPLDSLNIRDKVRAVITSVNDETEKLTASMLPWALPEEQEDVKLGVITDEDISLNYLKTKSIDGLPYAMIMESNPAFQNSNLECLLTKFYIEDENPPSFMMGLKNLHIPKHEYAEELRKMQSYKWSLRSVAEGVSHFKAGRYTEAMQHLNKALQIDPENVEALVARGALYANNESYLRAIEDFERSLELNPMHGNARKYICQTLVAYGRSLQDSKKYRDAMAFYKRALSINTEFLEAQECIAELDQQSKDENEEDLNYMDLGYMHKDSESPEKVDPKTSSGLDKTAETLKKLIEEDEKGSRRKKRAKRTDSHASGDSPTKSSHEDEINPDNDGHSYQRFSDNSHEHTWDHGETLQDDPYFPDKPATTFMNAPHSLSNENSRKHIFELEKSTQKSVSKSPPLPRSRSPKRSRHEQPNLRSTSFSRHQSTTNRQMSRDNLSPTNQQFSSLTTGHRLHYDQPPGHQLPESERYYSQSRDTFARIPGLSSPSPERSKSALPNSLKEDNLRNLPRFSNTKRTPPPDDKRYLTKQPYHLQDKSETKDDRESKDHPNYEHRSSGDHKKTESNRSQVKEQGTPEQAEASGLVAYSRSPTPERRGSLKTRSRDYRHSRSGRDYDGDYRSRDERSRQDDNKFSGVERANDYRWKGRDDYSSHQKDVDRYGRSPRDNYDSRSRDRYEQQSRERYDRDRRSRECDKRISRERDDRRSRERDDRRSRERDDRRSRERDDRRSRERDDKRARERDNGKSRECDDRRSRERDDRSSRERDAGSQDCVDEKTSDNKNLSSKSQNDRFSKVRDYSKASNQDGQQPLPQEENEQMSEQLKREYVDHGSSERDNRRQYERDVQSVSDRDSRRSRERSNDPYPEPSGSSRHERNSRRSYEHDSDYQSRKRRHDKGDSPVLPEKEVRYGMWEKQRISRFDSSASHAKATNEREGKETSGKIDKNILMYDTSKGNVAGSQDSFVKDMYQFIKKEEDPEGDRSRGHHDGGKAINAPQQAAFVSTGWKEAENNTNKKRFSDDLKVSVAFDGGQGSRQVVKEEFSSAKDESTRNVTVVKTNSEDKDDNAGSGAQLTDMLDFDELQKKLQQYWKSETETVEKPKEIEDQKKVQTVKEKPLSTDHEEPLIKPETTYRKRKLSTGSSSSSSSSSSSGSDSRSRSYSSRSRSRTRSQRRRLQSYSRSRRKSRSRSRSRRHYLSRSGSKNRRSHSRSRSKKRSYSCRKRSRSHSRNRGHSFRQSRSRSRGHSKHKRYSRSRSRSRVGSKPRHGYTGRGRGSHFVQESVRGRNTFFKGRPRSRARSPDKSDKKDRWWSPSRSLNKKDRLYAKSANRFEEDNSGTKGSVDASKTSELKKEIKPEKTAQVSASPSEKIENSSSYKSVPEVTLVTSLEKASSVLKGPEKVSFSIKSAPKVQPKSSVIKPGETRNSLVEMEKFLKNLKEKKKEELNEKFKFQLKKQPDKKVW